MRNLNDIRKELGIPPLEPGMKECLMCEKLFYSWDKRKNRRCPECQAMIDSHEPEAEEVYWDDLDTVVIDIDADYIDFINDCPDYMDKL